MRKSDRFPFERAVKTHRFFCRTGDAFRGIFCNLYNAVLRSSKVCSLSYAIDLYILRLLSYLRNKARRTASDLFFDFA